MLMRKAYFVFSLEMHLFNLIFNTRVPFIPSSYKNNLVILFILGIFPYSLKCRPLLPYPRKRGVSRVQILVRDASRR